MRLPPDRPFNTSHLKICSSPSYGHPLASLGGDRRITMITRRATCGLPMLLAANYAFAEVGATITLRAADQGNDDKVAAFAQQLSAAGVAVASAPGYGPLQNAGNLVEHREAEVAVLPADLMLRLRQLNRGDAAKSLRYITWFDSLPVHILAGQPIRDLTQLSGQRVGFGASDSVSFVSATELFNLLNLSVQPFAAQPTDALQMVRRRQLAALVYIGDAPARLFFGLNRQQDGVQFLPVEQTAALTRTYVPALLKIEDYPLLIGEGEAGSGTPVPTIAVPMLLAVDDWPVGSYQYRRLSRFAAACPQTSSPGSEVSDWVRFVPNLGPPQPVARTAPNSPPNLTPQQRGSLFREFEKSQQGQ
jgi:hypothetical protein